MRRSLPSGMRVIPAFLITLLTTLFLYRLIFPSHRSSVHLLSDKCDVDGTCEADDKDIKQPPTRSEFQALQNTVNSLRQDMESLKVPRPKELTPDEQQWESRRTGCGHGVERNIDYQHVDPPEMYLTIERST
jgi:hypothetical protein